MRLLSMKLENLRQLLVEELKDIYDAEQQRTNISRATSLARC